MRTETHGKIRVALTPLLIGAEAVGKLLGVSTRTVWNMHQDGQLPLPISLRGTTRWKTEEIAEWVQAGCPNRERWLAIRESN